MQEETIPRIISIAAHSGKDGKLHVFECGDLAGFSFQRVYYIRGASSEAVRGRHGHKQLKQLMIAVNGSFSIILKRGEHSYQFHLDTADKGLFIPAGYYRELYQFSPDACCMVLASDRYDESDYIRGHDNFVEWEDAQRSITQVPFTTLDREYQARRDAFDNAYHRVMNRAHFILGPEVEAFEKAFAGFVGCRYAIGVGNGLEALALTLEAWGIGSGDEVIIPAHTYIATALAVSRLGSSVIVVDVDPGTCELNVAALEQAITPRTKAVIPVHMYGLMANMTAIQGLCHSRGIKILEDASQSHGAMCDGRNAGAIGDAAAFSLYPTKVLGAFGDAGIITTNDETLYARLRMLRNYGSIKKYEHEILGTNSRLDEMQAAFLNVKMHHLKKDISRRQALARLYDSGFKATSSITRQTYSDRFSHVYYAYPIRVDAAQRDGLVSYLADKGIQTIIHYPKPIHLHEAYRGKLPYQAGDFPVAESIAAQSLCLPISGFHRDDEIDYVINAVNEYMHG